MRVVRIWQADIYRDGGSYGFCFDADDGQWYEFFVRRRMRLIQPPDPFAAPTINREGYEAPVIYRQGVNSHQVESRLSWAEGKEFIAPLSYDNDRFRELVSIVKSDGKLA
jgi:hypothetical protein